MDIILISHGQPKHACFAIIQPSRGHYTDRCRLVNGKQGEIYKLTSPDDGVEVFAELLDLYVYTIRELPESSCYWAYGMNKEKLIRALMNKYPRLREDSEIELLLLRRCKLKDGE